MPGLIRCGKPTRSFGNSPILNALRQRYLSETVIGTCRSPFRRKQELIDPVAPEAEFASIRNYAESPGS
jgi:hypothetical protein